MEKKIRWNKENIDIFNDAEERSVRRCKRGEKKERKKERKSEIRESASVFFLLSVTLTPLQGKHVRQEPLLLLSVPTAPRSREEAARRRRGGVGGMDEDGTRTPE